MANRALVSEATNLEFVQPKKITKLQQKLLIQKLMGLCILIFCVIIGWLCAAGITVEDKDSTVLVLLIPLGIYLLLTKQIVVN